MTEATAKITTADHTANVTAIVTATLANVDTVTDDMKTRIADAMRSVPAPSRGTVQSAVLLSIMSDPSIDASLIGDAVLTVWSDLSTFATTATRAKVEKDPAETMAQHFVNLRAAADIVLFVGGTGDMAERFNTFTNTVGVDMAAVERIIADVTKSTATRATFTDTLADIVASGRLADGTALVGRYGDAKATLTTTGIKVNGKTYDNPSAAASQKVTGAVNGWAFWCVVVDGKKVPLSTYRSA